MGKYTDLVKQILQENWIDTYKINGINVEVFENPTRKTVQAISSKNHGEVKMLYNLVDNKLYVFSPSEINHEIVAKKLNLKKGEHLHIYAIGRREELDFYAMMGSEKKDIKINARFRKSEGYEKVQKLFPTYTYAPRI